MTTASAPPASVLPDFLGKPNTPDRTFFLPPPPDIGELLSAETTVLNGNVGMSWTRRILICALATLLPAAIWTLIIANYRAHGPRDLPVFLEALIAGACVFVALSAILIPLVLYFTRRVSRCAYIGREGIIRYTVNGPLTNRPRTEYLLFANAAELRTSLTRHYHNGIYMGTKYSFIWTNPNGQRLLKLASSFYNAKGKPKPGNPYYFALAAELAWSNFLLRRADAELADHGFLTFNLARGKSVLIAPGWIEFHFNGRTDRCDAHDIQTITLAGGQFTIKHKDARWYSSKGKFSFPYKTMSNARLFLFALDKFLPPSTWAASPTQNTSES